MSEVEAVLLAGGRGKRMGEATLEMQKCLLPIDGKPMLGYILESLVTALVSVDLKVAVSYKASDVMNFIDNNKSPMINVKYVPHDNRGDSWGAYYSVRNDVNSPFVGLPGDVVADPRVYSEAIRTYYEKRVDLIMSVSSEVDKIDTHALVEECNGEVVDIVWPVVDKTSTSGFHRDMTIYASDERFFGFLKKYEAPGSAVVKSFRDALLADDIAIDANVVDTPWVHLGYPQDLGFRW